VTPVKRTSCSGCGSEQLDQFLDLGDSPVADAYTVTRDEVSPRYPLQVAVCGKCHLVQLLEVLGGGELFGTGYSFYSSASAPLSAYHAEYARSVLATHSALAADGVVEIGSNDGDLLRHFTDFPHLGIDPSTGPAAAAAERGCDVLVEPFGLDVARRIRSERGPRGLVLANHVLAHVEDLADCLAGIAHLLQDDGIAVVEVQYLPDLLVNNAFDLVYHEHRNYFSLSSLEHAAARHGLYVVDAELTTRQGGSLRLTLAKHHEVILTPGPAVRTLRSSERWLQSFGAYEGMQGRAERIRTRLLDLLTEQDGITAVYGAPAKATTLLTFCGLTSDDLPWCVDTTPAKQGRHIPGTGIPIVGPDFMGAGTYLLTAHNYAAQIIRRNPYKRFIVPIPAPVLL
jgi:hypothetical protein